jgi:hypothetical protein
MKRIYTYIKRRIILFFGKTRYKNYIDEVIDANEKVCKSICIRMINHEKSQFLLAPISMKRFIKNDDLGIFILLYNKRIKITNNKYHYDIEFLERDWDRLCYLYDNKTEKIREELENGVFNKINDSLNNILITIKKDGV